MKIIKVANQDQGSQRALEIFSAEKIAGARTFGLATGSTPLGLYRLLSASNLDFKRSFSINLDEYVGLGRDDPQSYRSFMNEHLFQAKPFQESFLPNGKATDLAVEAKSYDKIIAEHPIDLQILGIGHNGHIGFNEPGTPFSSQTHVVDLAESTIKANQRFFTSIADVPTKAISMGIKSIMSAKKILLLAWGESKAEAIKAMIEGEVTEMMPASILQKHDEVTVIVDQEAGKLLS